MDYLPYGHQWIDEDDIRAVAEVLKSDWLTTGPKVEEFERRLADQVGAAYAVAVNSGTAALHAAYFAAGLQAGDEIITTPITFAATANAALYLGAKPSFVDVEYRSGNIEANLIEKAITKKTKIIAPVSFAGQPADMDRINEIAKQNGLIVVEDAAHALEAVYKGRKTGTLADLTTFSFHPVKHITTGEGGAVTTDNYDYYKRLLMFRSHGITKDTEDMEENHGPWYYEMQDLGYNYRMTDFQCALGISQLEKLERFVEKRRWIADEYTKRLARLNQYLELPFQHDNRNSSWHLYVIKVKGGAAVRKGLFDYLRGQNIGVQVHYVPVYRHPYYRNLGYLKGICPEAEKFYERAISLPIFPKMSEDDIGRVCSEICEYFAISYR